MKKMILVGFLLVCLLFSACTPAVGPSSDSGKPATDAATDSASSSTPKTDSVHTEDSSTLSSLQDTGATEDSVGTADETLTEAELLQAYESGAKIPEALVPEALLGYGRILKSAATSEEAIANATAYFTTAENDVKACELLIESNLYFGLSVSQGPKGSDTHTSEHKVVCFKPDVFDTDYLNAYRDKTGTFGAVSKSIAKRVMDYWSYSRWIDDGGVKILSSKMEEADGEYRYTVYYLTPLYDDFGEVMAVSFYRAATKIPKSGGTVTFGKAEKLLTAKP